MPSLSKEGLGPTQTNGSVVAITVAVTHSSLSVESFLFSGLNMYSFNFHKTPGRWVLLLPPFYRGETSTEK